jgi:hypothetical protein
MYIRQRQARGLTANFYFVFREMTKKRPIHLRY